jgi:hypothetical protein
VSTPPPFSPDLAVWLQESGLAFCIGFSVPCPAVGHPAGSSLCAVFCRYAYLCIRLSLRAACLPVLLPLLPVCLCELLVSLSFYPFDCFSELHASLSFCPSKHAPNSKNGWNGEQRPSRRVVCLPVVLGHRLRSDRCLRLQQGEGPGLTKDAASYSSCKHATRRPIVHVNTRRASRPHSLLAACHSACLPRSSENDQKAKELSSLREQLRRAEETERPLAARVRGLQADKDAAAEEVAAVRGPLVACKIGTERPIVHPK